MCFLCHCSARKCWCGFRSRLTGTLVWERTLAEPVCIGGVLGGTPPSTAVFPVCTKRLYWSLCAGVRNAQKC